MASKYEVQKFSRIGDSVRSREISDQTHENADPLFEREWDVFVVKRDPATGTFISRTACCEDALSS